METSAVGQMRPLAVDLTQALRAVLVRDAGAARVAHFSQGVPATENSSHSQRAALFAPAIAAAKFHKRNSSTRQLIRYACRDTYACTQINSFLTT